MMDVNIRWPVNDPPKLDPHYKGALADKPLWSYSDRFTFIRRAIAQGGKESTWRTLRNV